MVCLLSSFFNFAFTKINYFSIRVMIFATFIRFTFCFRVRLPFSFSVFVTLWIVFLFCFWFGISFCSSFNLLILMPNIFSISHHFFVGAQNNMVDEMNFRIDNSNNNDDVVLPVLCWCLKCAFKFRELSKYNVFYLSSFSLKVQKFRYLMIRIFGYGREREAKKWVCFAALTPTKILRREQLMKL